MAIERIAVRLKQILTCLILKHCAEVGSQICRIHLICQEACDRIQVAVRKHLLTLRRYLGTDHAVSVDILVDQPVLIPIPLQGIHAGKILSPGQSFCSGFCQGVAHKVQHRIIAANQVAQQAFIIVLNNEFHERIYLLNEGAVEKLFHGLVVIDGIVNDPGNGLVIDPFHIFA